MDIEKKLGSLRKSLEKDLSQVGLTDEEALKIYMNWGWRYVHTIVHFWFDDSRMTDLTNLKSEYAAALYDLFELEESVLRDGFSSYSCLIRSKKDLLQVWLLQVFISDFLIEKIEQGNLNQEYALSVLSIGTGYDPETKQRLKGQSTLSWGYLKSINDYVPRLLVLLDKDGQVNLLHFLYAFVTVTTNEDGVTERGCALLNELEDHLDIEEGKGMTSSVLQKPLSLILVEIWENFFDWLYEEDLIPDVAYFDEELAGVDTKSHDEKYALLRRWCRYLVTIFDFHVTFLGVEDFLEFVSSPDNYAKKIGRDFYEVPMVLSFSDSLKILVEIWRDDWGKAELIAKAMYEDQEPDGRELAVPYLLGLLKKK